MSTEATISPEQMRMAYRMHPETFCRHAFDVSLWSKQREILRSVFANKRTAVVSGHSTGKTFTLAAAVISYLYLTPDSIVISTAPTYRQVKELLWREIGRLYGRAAALGKPLGGELMQMKLQISPQHFACGFSTDSGDSAVRFQGWHSPGGVLVVFDEGAGVPAETWQAAEAALAGDNCKMVVAGNPISKTGPFFEACISPKWHRIEVSSWDTPNAKSGKDKIPGLASREWCKEMLEQYGESSPIYQTRVLGQFPEIGGDTLIQFRWVQDAQTRPRVASGPRAGGVDVARFGDDLTCIIGMDGGHVVEIRKGSGWDTQRTAGEVVEMYRRLGWESVCVDDGGVGGGVVDALNRHPGLTVLPINFGSTAMRESEYANRATELFCLLAEDLKAGAISGMPSGEIVRELCQRTYDFDLRQRLKIEPKESFKKRVGHSPDEGDALMLANQARRFAGAGAGFLSQIYV